MNEDQMASQVQEALAQATEDLNKYQPSGKNKSLEKHLRDVDEVIRLLDKGTMYPEFWKLIGGKRFTKVPGYPEIKRIQITLMSLMMELASGEKVDEVRISACSSAALLARAFWTPWPTQNYQKT